MGTLVRNGLREGVTTQTVTPRNPTPGAIIFSNAFDPSGTLFITVEYNY